MLLKDHADEFNEIRRQEVLLRKKMIQYRERLYANLEDMARFCKCSMILLEYVERGDYTHPNIARRIAEKYKLTPMEAELLVHPTRREHDLRYAPPDYTIPFYDSKRLF